MKKLEKIQVNERYVSVKIPENLQEKWQNMLNLLAELLDIPVALLMRISSPDYLSVCVASDNPGNPFERGQREKLDGLYCRTVLKKQTKFHVSNALHSALWRESPGAHKGLIAYLGVPVNFPDGSPFGTICVFDKKENPFGKVPEKLLRQYRDVIELDLKIHIDNLARQREYENAISLSNLAMKAIKKAVEQSGNAIIITDQHGAIEYVNREFVRLSGYQFKEVKGKNPRFLKSGMHNTKFYRQMWQELSKGKVWRGELHNKAKNNDLFWVQATISPVTNETGKITHYLGIFTDITQQKTSEERLQTLIDASPDPIFFKDAKGRWLEANRAGLALFQLQGIDYKGKTDRELAQFTDFYKEALLFCEKTDQQAWEKGKLDIYQEKVPLPQGGIKIFETIKVPLFNKDNSRKGLVIIGRDISHRQKVVEKLKESEERFKAIFKQDRSVKLLIDIETGLIEDANQAAIEFYGYSFAELQKLNIAQINLLSEAQVKAEMEKARRQKNNCFNFKHLLACGEIRDVEVYSTPIHFAGKTKLFSIIHDITDRRKAEKTIKEQNELLSEILNGFEQGVYLANADFEIEYMNPAMIEKTGYNAVGEKCYRAIYGQQNVCPWCYYPELKQNKGKISVNRSYKNRHYIITAVILKNKKKLTVYQDISKIKESEEALKNSEERFKQLSNLTFEGIIIHNNGVVIDINLSFLRMFGYSRQEIIGKNIVEILVPKQYHDIVRTKTRNEYSAPYEIKAHKKDGTIIHVEIESKKIITQNNHPARVAALRDITERKKAENQLKKQKNEYAALYQEYKKQNEELTLAKEHAEEGNRLKTAFLNNISHEFRTPMNGILGFADLIISPNRSEEQKQKYAAIIRESCDKLLDIVTDTVEISQVQSQIVEVKKTATDIEQLIGQVVEKIQYKTIDKQLEIRKKIKLSDEEKYLKTDAPKLFRAIKHLLENAIKFTAQGVVEISCHKNSHNEIEISVSDTGIGIAPEMQELVFEPFRQVEKGLSRNYGGSGIGLSLVKAYIEMLGGHIELHSQTGKGTQFILFLPDEKALEIPQKPLEQQIKPTDCSNLTILVAEDEATNFFYLEEILLSSKAKVLHAYDGQQAVNMCRQKSRIDLILMDLKMPKMDGYQATAIIKEFRPGIPVVAQTAYALPNDIERIKASHFDDYLVKPIKKETLLSAIQRNLNKF